MRDAHRMKEKLDLSLDNRQIVSLLLGGIVVLGAVFVLGVVVGKKLAEGGAAQTAPDLIAALDQQAAAMEKVRAGAKPELTFQKVLTEDHDVRVVKAAPKPEPAAAPAEPDEKPEPKPEVVRVQPPPAVKESPPPAVTASVKAPDEAKPSELKAAIAKAQLPPPAGSFCLQLSATQVRAEADRFAANLQDRGYAPYVVTAEVPGKGTWYRVRLGRFPSKDAANKYLQDFRRETRMEAFIAVN